MKKISTGFVFFFLLLPVLGFADETANSTNPSQQMQGYTSNLTITVQASAFSSPKRADELIEKLKKNEINCGVHEKENLFKVYCGEFRTKEDAKILRDKLFLLGYKDAFLTSLSKISQNPVSPPNPIQSVQQTQVVDSTLRDDTSPEAPASVPPIPEVEDSTLQAVEQDKPVIEEKPAPPPIPSATSFTPEQIKAFLSKSKPKENNYIILNFDNANLRDVINTISSITGENFILSPGLEARITVHSAGKIPVSEALSVFESILEVNNMSLVKSGQFYKIVSGPTVKQKPIEVRKGKEAESIPPVDTPITQVIPVEYVPVSELSPLLQPMLSPFGSLIPNPRNNLLIVNDIASNIKRLLTVLKEIDVSAFQNTRMGFFQPKYSDVKTIAEELTAITNALNLGREGTVTMVPIERINGLVVFSSSSSLLQIVEGWFKKLDEEIITGQNIFVYPVQNVKAESIANILKAIYGTGEITTAKPKTTTTPSQPAQRPPQVSVPKQQETKLEIAVFEPTNSIVILAPPGVYREMVETIKKLDAYPQEVLIEVIIAEVTLTDTDQFGIQWSVLKSDVDITGDVKDATGLVQSTQDPTIGAPSISATAPTLAGGPIGLSFSLFKPEKLIAMLHALASRGKVDILSSPRLLVRNQEEANIDVGSEIPTATSTTTAAAATTTTSTLTQNIEYKTVGIKLKIKPTINQEKTVVLDLEQEVSDVISVGQTVGGLTYPSFTTRKTKTSVVVPDKQSIVIGGIMKEKTTKSYQGVPLLSSIPILGNLFRYTVDKKEKTELIILLTPYVVTNKMEADVLTMEFLDKLKEVKSFLKKNEDQINIPALEEDKSSSESSRTDPSQ